MENLESQVFENLEKNQMVKSLMKNVLISRLITIGLAILAGFILIRIAAKGLDEFLNKNQGSRDSVGINTSSLIATAGIGGIAIAFGSQTIIQDFIMGIFIVVDDRIRVGDWVVAAGCEGTVEQLNLRTTLIRDFNGSLHIIPNSKIANVQNFNRGKALAQVTFSLPYEVSLAEAKEIVETVADKLKGNPEFKGKVVSCFEFFEISSFEPIVYIVKMIATTKDGYQWAYQRAARALVKEEMEKRNIRANKVEIGNEKVQTK